MENIQEWSVVAFKHGKYAIVKSGIVSQTLAKSNARAKKQLPEFAKILVREIRSDLISGKNELTLEKLTIEELLNLK